MQITLCGDYIKVRFTTLAFSKASELTAASQHAVCTALSPLVQARPWQCWCPGAAATAPCCAGTHTHHHQPATTPAQITQRTGQLPRPLNNLQKGGVRAWQQLPVCTGAVPEQPPPLQGTLSSPSCARAPGALVGCASPGAAPHTHCPAGHTFGCLC